jgi:ATP synthase protein I
MFPASIAIGGLFGYFFDRWLHTAPWLLIVFILYGVAAGFVNLVQVTRRYESRK